jgi:hypothetical protein
MMNRRWNVWEEKGYRVLFFFSIKVFFNSRGKVKSAAIIFHLNSFPIFFSFFRFSWVPIYNHDLIFRVQKIVHFLLVVKNMSFFFQTLCVFFFFLLKKKTVVRSFFNSKIINIILSRTFSLIFFFFFQRHYIDTGVPFNWTMKFRNSFRRGYWILMNRIKYTVVEEIPLGSLKRDSGFHRILRAIREVLLCRRA